MGEDKAYDTADHVANLRTLNVTSHVTQNDSIIATGKRPQSAIEIDKQNLAFFAPAG